MYNLVDMLGCQAVALSSTKQIVTSCTKYANIYATHNHTAIKHVTRRLYTDVDNAENDNNDHEFRALKTASVKFHLSEHQLIVVSLKDITGR